MSMTSADETSTNAVSAEFIGLSSPELLRRRITGFMPDIKNQTLINMINLKLIYLVACLTSYYNIVN